MAEKIIFSSDEQKIISKVCSELNLTEEQTKNIRLIMEKVEQTSSIKNSNKKLEARLEAMMTLTANYPPERQVLMGHAVRLIWSLVVELRMQQVMARLKLSAALN